MYCCALPKTTATSPPPRTAPGQCVCVENDPRKNNHSLDTGYSVMYDSAVSPGKNKQTNRLVECALTHRNTSPARVSIDNRDDTNTTFLSQSRADTTRQRLRGLRHRNTTEGSKSSPEPNPFPQAAAAD